MQEVELLGEASVEIEAGLERVAEASVRQWRRRRGLSLADVERGERPHRCGRCMNPFLRAGNSECPRLAQAVKEASEQRMAAEVEVK